MRYLEEMDYNVEEKEKKYMKINRKKCFIHYA
jgi:hypothetical protein